MENKRWDALSKRANKLTAEGAQVLAGALASEDPDALERALEAVERADRGRNRYTRRE